MRAMRRILVLLAATVGAAAAPSSAEASAYVALGDSYTAAPFVLFPHGEPIDCARSTRNYPALVSRSIGLRVNDVSCPGARTEHAYSPQGNLLLGGTNPAQLDAVTSDAFLVTVGLGANDSQIFQAASTCLGFADTTGTACRDRFGAPGPGSLREQIELVGPRVAQLIAAVRTRAPRARVLVVGYPAVTPSDGRSCPAVVPLSADDHRFIDELIRRLNAVIEGQADRLGVEFVDTYTPSVGHDVCAQDRWIEGVLLSDVSTPLHPNAKGEEGFANSVLVTLRTPREATPPAPRLERVRVVRRPRTAGPPARVSVRLDRPADVTFTLQRRFSGRRDAQGRCRPRSRSRRNGRTCVSYTRGRSTDAVGLSAGTSVVRLTRAIVGRRAGVHRLVVRAEGPGGRSTPARLKVRVGRPSTRR